MKKRILSLALVVALVAIMLTSFTLAYFTDVDTVKNAFTMGKVDIVLDEAPVGADGKEVGGNRVQHIDYTATNMVPGYEFDKDPTIHVLKGSEDSYIFMDVTINKYSSLFWVMAADAAEDAEINLPLYNNGKLATEFANDNGVFSTTKFVKYLQDNKNVLRAIMDKWFVGITHTDWAIEEVFIGVEKEDATKPGKFLTLRLAYQGDTDNTPNTVNAKEITEDSIDIKFMDAFKMPASVTQKMIADGKEIGGMMNVFNTTEEEFHLNFKAYAIQAAELDTVDDAYAAMFS